jgi:hypothetical protein
MNPLVMLILACAGSFLTIYGIISLKRGKIRGPWWASKTRQDFLGWGRLFTKKDDPDNFWMFVILDLCFGILALIGVFGALFGFW